MAIFKSFTFDNINSMDYGVYITGSGVYNAPERSVEMVSIPGRNGALSLDQGRFENIEVTYHCGCFADGAIDFATKIANFRNALVSRFNYARLTDEYNPGEYRLGLYHSGIVLEPFNAHAGEFDVVFDCKPQRYLTSGESYQTVTSSILNPTLFDAKPLLKITGYGTATIGGVTITITGSSGVVTYIDCDLMECYRMSGGAIVPAGSAVTITGMKYPVLKPGANGVSKSGNVTKIEIMPRWWSV